MTDDLIRREDVIELVYGTLADGLMLDTLIMRLNMIPSAEPKRGMWTKAYDGYDGHVCCTSCFKIYDWDSQAQYYNFCPNCGAKMEMEYE